MIPHIGINIHRDGVSALQLKVNRQGNSIRAATHLPIEVPLTGASEDLGALKPAIQSMARQRIFKGKRVIVSLPQEYLSAFPVTIETTSQQPFEMVLTKACGKHLSFPLDQAVLDYFCVEKMSEAGHKLRVTVVAARREQIDKVIGTFKQAGLKVDLIDYGLCALIRLHNQIHALGKAPSVLVHMDDTSTLIAVATKTEIVAHRHLDWGVGRLRHCIAETLQFDQEAQRTEQAQAMLRDYGVDYDAFQDASIEPQEKQRPKNADEIAALRVVSQILVPNMEEMVRELFQIIGYARSLSPEIQFRELWLYGMATEIKNLGPFLEKRLRISTHCMAPFERLALHNMSAIDATALNSYVGALGLALRGAQ